MGLIRMGRKGREAGERWGVGVGVGGGGRGKSVKGEGREWLGGGGVRIRNTVKPVRPTAALM